MAEKDVVDLGKEGGGYKCYGALNAGVAPLKIGRIFLLVEETIDKGGTSRPEVLRTRAKRAKKEFRGGSENKKRYLSCLGLD